MNFSYSSSLSHVGLKSTSNLRKQIILKKGMNWKERCFLLYKKRAFLRKLETNRWKRNRFLWKDKTKEKQKKMNNLKERFRQDYRFCWKANRYYSVERKDWNRALWNPTASNYSTGEKISKISKINKLTAGSYLNNYKKNPFSSWANNFMTSFTKRKYRSR